MSEEKSIETSEHEAAAEIPSLPLRAQVAAVLFVSSRPLTADKLASVTQASEEDVLAACEELQTAFIDELHGFSLHEVAGGWQLRTAPGVSAVLRRLVPARARRLSRAAAETLAVVAYKQPVQKAEIEGIRGVDVLPTLRTLLDAKLIRIVGRLDAAGQPALYGTTEKFLEKFGLRDLSQLPTVRELEQVFSDPGEGENQQEDGDEDEVDTFDLDE